MAIIFQHTVKLVAPYINTDTPVLLHKDNTVSIILDQRKLSRMKLVDVESYTKLMETHSAYYIINQELDGENLTFLRTTYEAAGMKPTDLSKCDFIELLVGETLTFEEYQQQRSTENATIELLTLVDSYAKITTG